MKKVIITIAIVIASMVAGNAQDRSQNFTQEGKTAEPTGYTWKDSKGNEYPIFLHTYSKGEKAGRTTCYVVKTSAKTGKEYKYYLPDGEAIASKILAESKNVNSRAI